jgi:hypothetical protein
LAFVGSAGWIRIIADIEARPAIQGVRSGRDEVLEAALRHVLGADASAAEIERLAKHRTGLSLLSRARPCAGP